MIKKYLSQMFDEAGKQNFENIISLLEKNNKAKFIDLGCDDGKHTLALAEVINTKQIYGAEIVKQRANMARSKGIEIKSFSLNDKFPYQDNSFDVIYSNQVIEHLYNSDNFIEEIHRTLKPGGYAIISTPNASSWSNIAASILGWQIFSLTNFSNKSKALGNPLALHKNEPVELESWNHVRIYNIRGLKEYFEAYKFTVEKMKGAGYFPFPAKLGNLDKTHSYYMTFKVRKAK